MGALKSPLLLKIPPSKNILSKRGVLCSEVDMFINKIDYPLKDDDAKLPTDILPASFLVAKVWQVFS